MDPAKSGGRDCDVNAFRQVFWFVATANAQFIRLLLRGARMLDKCEGEPGKMHELF